MQLEVNGLVTEASYPEEMTEMVFLPALKEWTRKQAEAGRRIFIFLMGAPGSGKSTLALFLEQLSRRTPGITPIQALGMDGFHYDNETLQRLHLQARKGAPFTFDTQALHEKIVEGRTCDNWWPVYSRKIHDPVPNQIRLQSPIILIEGNYLFLDAPGWKELASLADERVWLETDPALLQQRLIDRKRQGGSTLAQAVSHYETSDRLNIQCVMENRLFSDRTWWLYNQDKEV